MLSIQQHKLTRVQKPVRVQLAGCSTAAARVHAVLRNARRLLLGYVFPLTAFPRIKVCCLQEDFGVRFFLFFLNTKVCLKLILIPELLKFGKMVPV